MLEDRTLLSAGLLLDLNGPDQSGTDFSTSFTEDLGPVSITDVDAQIQSSGDTAYIADGFGNQIVSIDLASGTQQVFSSGGNFNILLDIEFNSSGDLIVGSLNNALLLSVDASNGTQTIIAQDDLLAGTHSVAVDSNDNVFVGQNNQIIRVPQFGSQSSLIAASGAFTGIDVDSSDNLYFVGNGNTLFRIDAVTGTLTTVNQIGSMFIGVSVSDTGALFLTDDANDTVWRFDVCTTTPLTGTFTQISSGGLLAGPLRHLDVDSGGDLIVTVDADGGRVVSIDSTSGQQTLIASGTSDLIVSPQGLTIAAGSASGNLASATVTLTAIPDGTDESLAADIAGTNVSAVYDSGTGILSLTGTDTVENYQQVLRSVTYNNVSQNPNITPRVIQFVVNDGSQDSNVATATVNVIAVNDPPVAMIGAGTPTTAVAGQSLEFSGSFVDPESQDTHNLTWEVRDAGNNLVATGSGAGFVFEPTTLGTFTVTFQVAETNTSELFTASDSVQVTVQPFVLAGGQLSVGGTTGNDNITIRRDFSSGGVRLIVNGQTLGTFGEVDQIVIYGGQGDDDIRIRGFVFVSTVIYGGDGNDRIRGGLGNDQIFGGDGDDDLRGSFGNDLMLGGAGNDTLAGNWGRDVLIGGDGADNLRGGFGGDLLISGFTSYDSDIVALDAIFREWTSAGSYVDRVNNLRTGAGSILDGIKLEAGTTVFNDDDVDVLTGQFGQDWFWASLEDDLTDQRFFEFFDQI